MISWQLLNHWALWVIYGAAVAVFVALFFVTAPYGRHGRPGWGLTLPEKWGWGVMEFPSVALIVLAFVASLLRYGTPHPVSILLMLVWETHYIYRTFVFSSLMREGPKQFPVLIVVFALTFNTLNGFVNGYHLFFEPMQYAIRWLVDPRFLAGIVVFFELPRRDGGMGGVGPVELVDGWTRLRGLHLRQPFPQGAVEPSLVPRDLRR